jgi:F0F1-type ATP synthase assembly protein I
VFIRGPELRHPSLIRHTEIVPPPKKSFMMQVGTYMGLAVLLPISSLTGYAIGYYLDKAFHTHFLYIVFLLLGIAYGIVQLIRQFLRDTRDG